MTSVLDSMASAHDALSFAVDSMTYVLARITTAFELMSHDSLLETVSLFIVRRHGINQEARLRSVDGASAR